MKCGLSIISKLLLYADIQKSSQNILFHNLKWFSVHIIILFWSNLFPNISFHIKNPQTLNRSLVSIKIWVILLVAVSSSTFGSSFWNMWDNRKAKNKTLPTKFFLTHWTSLGSKIWRQNVWFPQPLLSHLLPWIRTLHW